jgi:predicted ArsR family transcriptional regulator
MANQISIDRIREAAIFLASPEAMAARGYLAPPLETALQILGCLGARALEYEEIAEETGINENTVRQVINALIQGGYPLQVHYIGLSKTGRKTATISL